jgi:hypothetical protein
VRGAGKQSQKREEKKITKKKKKITKKKSLQLDVFVF